MRSRSTLAAAVAALLASAAGASVTTLTANGVNFDSLDASMRNDDMIAGVIGTEGFQDRGWHPVNPAASNSNDPQGLPAFTDGVGELPGVNFTGLLNDFPPIGDPTKQVEYYFDNPVNIGFINIFAANKVNRDERAMSVAVVSVSSDGFNFVPVGYFQSHPSGTINADGHPNTIGIGSSRLEINATAAQMDNVLAIQFNLFSTGNTQGQMRDPFDGVNPFTGVDDGLSPSFVSSKIIEIDVLPVTRSTWSVDAGGAWSNGANWTGGSPDGEGVIAAFGGAITAPRTVQLDGARTLGALNFDNASGYAISGDGITLDQLYARAAINVFDGAHTLAAPLNVVDPLLVDTQGAARLAVTGAMTSASPIDKIGAGVLAVANLDTAAAVGVGDGTLRIGASAAEGGVASGVARVGALNLAGAPGAWTANVDVASGALIIDYAAASPLEDVRDQIIAGYAAGAWSGFGINSSAGDATVRGLGYAEATALGVSSFAGVAIDGAAVIVASTFYGDTNLDGAVDVTDLGNLASGWQQAGDWLQGDFNYDGLVDVADLGALATNWQAGVAGPAAPDASFHRALQSVGLGSVIPEPASLSLIALAAIAVRRRR